MIAPWVEALVPLFPVLDFMAEYTAEKLWPELVASGPKMVKALSKDDKE